MERIYIRKKILDITPEFNDIHLLEDNFLRNTFKDYATGFEISKNVCMSIDAALLLSLPFVSQYINEEQVLQVKTTRFFFYFMGLVLFVL